MSPKISCLFSFLLAVVHSAVIIDPNTVALDPMQTFLGTGGIHGSRDVDHVFSDELHDVNDFLEDLFDDESHESRNPVFGVHVESAEREDSHGDISDDHSVDRDHSDGKDDSGERDNHSKDDDNHSYDNDGHSSDHDNNHSKDADNHSKDDDNHSKDNDNHSKDNDNHSKNNDNHSKDNDNHSKDNDNHSKDNDNHSKDNDNHSKDNDNHSKDKDTNSKNGDDNSREDSQKSKDNDSKDKDNKSKDDSDRDNKSKDGDDKSRDNDRSGVRDTSRRSRQRHGRRDDSGEDGNDEEVFRSLFRARGYLEAFESWRETARAAQTGTCPLYPVKVETDTITITTQNGCHIVIQLKGVTVDQVQTVQDSLARTSRAVTISYNSDK